MVDLMKDFFHMGISTFAFDLTTTVPVPAAGANPTTAIPIAKTLPTNIGLIYGLTVYADGLDSAGNTLITTTQAQGLFMTLKDGGTEFLHNIRLSDMLNEFAGSPIVRQEKYMSVVIPSFDVSQSFYANPNGFTTGVIRLKLWYIQKAPWMRWRKVIQDKVSKQFKEAGE